MTSTHGRGRVMVRRAMRRAADEDRIGFWTGAAAAFDGLRFIVTTPSLWPLALVPVTIASALFALLGFGAVAFTSELVRDGLGPSASAVGALGASLLRFALAALGLSLALVVAVALAQPLSGPALERIATLRERALGAPPSREVPLAASVFRSLRITSFALLVGLPTLGLLALAGLIVPPATVVTAPLGFFVSALLIAWDMLDPSLGARDVGVRARLAFFRRHFSAVAGFGLALAVVLLLPCTGLLVLPVGVAGASGLLVRIERSRPSQPNAGLEVVAP